MASFDVIPKRPAEPARAFSSSREVLVSSVFNSSFSSITPSFVNPVYLRVSAIASSISANAETHFRTVIDKPVKAAKP